jgi:hypothetical protein
VLVALAGVDVLLVVDASDVMVEVAVVEDALPVISVMAGGVDVAAVVVVVVALSSDAKVELATIC